MCNLHGVVLKSKVEAWHHGLIAPQCLLGFVPQDSDSKL